MSAYMTKNVSESREIMLHSSSKPNINHVTQAPAEYIAKALVDPFTKLTASFDFSASEFSIFDDKPEAPSTSKKQSVLPQPLCSAVHCAE